MNYFRASIKFILFAFFVLTYFACTIPVYLFLFVLLKKPIAYRRYSLLMVTLHCQIAIKIFGLKVRLVGRPWPYPQSSLIVCNHLSYVDVLTLSSLSPACFITSVEVKEMFFLGQLTQLGGCVFVERRSRKSLSLEVNEVTEVLRKGINVGLFAEATSTNGSGVLRSRRPLFQACIDAGATLLPLTLNYRFIDGRPVTESNRDQICWYGDMEFLSHFWHFLQAKRVDLEIVVAESIKVGPEREVTELSEEAHRIISGSFRPLGPLV